MATPLTLYIPIKQDDAAQQAAQALYQSFRTGDHSVLIDSNLLHYVRIALVPNLPGTQGTLAVLLITTFDEAMLPYLKYFWNIPSIQQVFQGISLIALTPPQPPVTDLNSFSNYIEANNLNKDPQDLWQAYSASTQEIVAAFGPATPAAN